MNQSKSSSIDSEPELEVVDTTRKLQDKDIGTIS